MLGLRTGRRVEETFTGSMQTERKKEEQMHFSAGGGRKDSYRALTPEGGGEGQCPKKITPPISFKSRNSAWTLRAHVLREGLRVDDAGPGP